MTDFARNRCRGATCDSFTLHSGKIQLLSRARSFRAKHRTTVNDVVGDLKTGIADLPLLTAIIPHHEMHGLVTGIYVIQQGVVQSFRSMASSRSYWASSGR